MEHTTHEHTTHTKSKSNIFIIISILIGSIIIAAAIIFSGNARNNNDSFIDPDTIFSGRELKQEEFLSGDLKNKVIILEYSDLECPFCKKFHLDTMNSVYEKYEGKVGFVFRHFPLSFHKLAPKEAEATLCARALGGQKIYKEYITKIFTETNGNDSLDPASLLKFTKELNLDTEKWTKCMDDLNYTKQVEADTEDGLSVGVQGTPNAYVLIKQPNNEYKILTVINGARDEKYVSRVIDQALKLSK
jgi:protein-disulfide isomerase